MQQRRVFPAGAWLYKSLAVSYTVLLGFLLPFICWGTMATPNHPHRMAHLVFFMPPMRADVSTVTSIADHIVDHSGHLPPQREGDDRSSASRPVGRSVPDELVSAISIISPLFVVQILLAFSPARLIRRLSQSRAAHLFDPRVLTPPPQRLYS